MVSFKSLASAGFVLVGLVSAHPGEKHDHQKIKRQIQTRDTIANLGQRSLNQCSGSLHARELKARSIARRAEKVEQLRKRLGIKTGMLKNPLSTFFVVLILFHSCQEAPP
jgi:ABC-type hemin transport system ATPase subunit